MSLILQGMVSRHRMVGRGDDRGLKLVLSMSYTLKESFGIVGSRFFSINDQMFIRREIGFELKQSCFFVTLHNFFIIFF